MNARQYALSSMLKGRAWRRRYASPVGRNPFSLLARTGDVSLLQRFAHYSTPMSAHCLHSIYSVPSRIQMKKLPTTTCLFARRSMFFSAREASEEPARPLHGARFIPIRHPSMLKAGRQPCCSTVEKLCVGMVCSSALKNRQCSECDAIVYSSPVLSIPIILTYIDKHGRTRRQMVT